MCIIDCLSTIVFILPLYLDDTKVIILILWRRTFQLEYWRTFQLVSTGMQGFSVKILPAGLEIFTENRRLDLAFPSNPGITFAPRTEMTAWCGSLKGAKMEVNENRGRLCRKKLQGKIRKKKNHQKEKDITGSVKRANHNKGSMIVSDPTELVQPGGNNHSSRFVRLCVGACFIHGAGWHTLHSLSASGKRNNEKRKIIWNPVKAPLGIGAKRKRHSIISLNIV